MILQASAASSFAGTWFIRAVAVLFVLLPITVHALILKMIRNYRFEIKT
jgi:hypothetical protein